MAENHSPENNCAPDEGGLSRPERDDGGANPRTATGGGSPVAPGEAIKSDALTHDTAAAVAFLERWRPGGPWVLTSITVERRGTTTRTFGAATKNELVDWIDQRQGIENLYFMVNPARRELTKKAEKSDVHALAWLHIDIDPRVGEDPAAEKARGEKLLRSFTPKATVVIDSGGGVQGFWRLEEPVVFSGDAARAEELEAYNQQLEILFGGDHCHNVDRIMRLPGTINVPDEKKRKKGRVPALAQLIEINDSAYPLKAFTPAARVQTKDSGLGSNTRIKISGNLPRLGSVDELPEEVTQRTKMLIVQGADPDDQTKYKSRSEVLFAVCCELVRAGCSDDTIAAVIMDPDFLISASVLDKPRPERYAARQIEQAREQAIDPMLRELNGKHAVIGDDGGRCRIISIVQDHALDRERISRQSFDDFCNRYRHIKVKVGLNDKGKDIEKPAGRWWVDHPNRRQYDTIVFAPGREVPNAFNLWTGFACEALPGDCSLFLAHIRENICSGNEEHYTYLLNWMARCVQHPAQPGEVAIVLKGKMGTGKGVLAKTFGALWGRHFMQVSDPKHLVGNFNAHLRDCVVLFGDEAFYAGDKKHESVLKMLITEETLAIEAKGVDVVASPNYVHLILASNNDWVIPAGQEERRFFVLKVDDRHMQDTAYFKAIHHQLAKGGREALLHMLMSMDISAFDVRRAPQTDALVGQKLMNMSPLANALFEIAQRGYGPDTDGARSRVPEGISVKALLDEVLGRLKRFGQNATPRLEQEIGQRLRDLALKKEGTGEPVSFKLRFGEERLTMYRMPPLARFRAEAFRGFEEFWRGQPTEWVDPNRPQPPTQGEMRIDDSSSFGWVPRDTSP